MNSSANETMWKFRFIAVWQEGKEVLWLKSMSAQVQTQPGMKP